ncbi:hypothetical protein JQC91_12360 [Jannaschia sp. Os4]|uniref:hypothetical protein n=1 Tax=Jannaschia sp. Os4 TaxID=2807617 RepID=UPI00193A0355|nr:hypothetical protein [Jannaschia sp. Os4]MBM2577092.1 hypothetical protein [Jannaschia sp. Os4]
MRLATTATVTALLLSGCAQVQDRLSGLRAGQQEEPVAVAPGADPNAPLPLPEGAVETVTLPTPDAAPNVAAPPSSVTASAAALDTVSEEEKQEAVAAAAAPAAGGPLGETVVSLGDPADAGLWVKTSLVTSDTPGTVTTSGGKSAAITLRPLDGAGGAQISLSALQTLGLPLVGLHPVTLARR